MLERLIAAGVPQTLILCVWLLAALAPEVGAEAPPAATTPAPAVKGTPVEQPPATDPMSPEGIWKTIDDETGEPRSLVRIFKDKGKLRGRIVKLFRKAGEDPDPVCDKCEGKLQGKPIVGMTILSGFSPDDDEWTGGTILDPANGKTYKCKLEVIEGGRKLKVRGYIGISLIGRTQIWLRSR